jgi:hypothetical protein
MADVGGTETAGFMAKAGAASSAGLLWGLFGSMVLIVPGIIMSLFAPLAKKAKDTVEAKVNNLPSPQARQPQQGTKVSKAEKEHQRKMQALQAEREEQELLERLQNLQKKKAKPRTTRESQAQSI